jgi:ABC-type multidrug transport system fused ATPase/permease subunit
VADNLRLGRPGAPEADLWQALELVGLAELVARLPAGLDTPMGEGGLTVSAGERHRLALARATLRDAPLVLLDEPAAHLDRTTEAELRASLGPWLDARTVLLAAHRTEIVARVDRLVALPLPGPAETAPVPGTIGARP